MITSFKVKISIKRYYPVHANMKIKYITDARFGIGAHFLPFQTRGFLQMHFPLRHRRFPLQTRPLYPTYPVHFPPFPRSEKDKTRI